MCFEVLIRTKRQYDNFGPVVSSIYHQTDAATVAAPTYANNDF